MIIFKKAKKHWSKPPFDGVGYVSSKMMLTFSKSKIEKEVIGEIIGFNRDEKKNSKSFVVSINDESRVVSVKKKSEYQSNKNKPN